MSSANESTPAGDAHHNLRERLETAAGAAKEVGVPLDALERVLFWWKHLGLRSAIYFFVVAPMNMIMERRHRGETPPDPTTKKCPECLSEIPIAARRCSCCTQPVR